MDVDVWDGEWVALVSCLVHVAGLACRSWSSGRARRGGCYRGRRGRRVNRGAVSGASALTELVPVLPPGSRVEEVRPDGTIVRVDLRSVR
jgi:hypothetical protein